MILLHIGGATTASIIVSVVVIFFMIFAVSFAFGKIPEGQHKLSGEWIGAWFRASIPRLIVAGTFAGALAAGALLLGNGNTASVSAGKACDNGVPPLTGKSLTDVRLLGSLDWIARVKSAADEGDAAGAQSLFFQLADAHALTHDIDRPLRDRDGALAKNLCLSVVVLENQMAGPLDTDVISREATLLSEYLTEARTLLDLAAVATTPNSEASDPCAQPIGAVSDLPLTAERLTAAIASMRQVSEEARSADPQTIQVLFFGDAHNITHDMDGPLREANNQLAVDLCDSVLALELEMGSSMDRAVVERLANTSADLLLQAREELGILP